MAKAKKYAAGGHTVTDPSVGTLLTEKYKRPHKEVEQEIRDLKNYQDHPDYWGKEDDSTSGRAAAEAYDSLKEPKDYYQPKKPYDYGMLSRTGVKKAQQAAKTVKEAETTNPMGDKYKKGGKVKSASARADGIAIRGKTRA